MTASFGNYYDLEKKKKHDFPLFCVFQTTFLYINKDCTLIYQRLTCFVMLFAYFMFLDIKLSTSSSSFYNTFDF